jgi:hypothetical protein
VSEADEFWQDNVPQSCECQDGWIMGYGYFPGGDPRNYSPDGECCSPEEIAAWKAACNRWNLGEKTDEGRSGTVVEINGVPGFACGHRFGIGTYRIPCFEDGCAWKRGETGGET